MSEIGRGRQLRLLSELCRSLAALGVGIAMRDAFPCLIVSVDQAARMDAGVCVFVSGSGDDFTWQGDGNRHPVSDVEGAARCIAEFVRQEHRPVPGEPGSVS